MKANRRRQHTTAALSVGIAGLLLVGACSGSDSGSSSSAAGRDASSGQAQSEAGGSAKPAAPKAGGKATGSSGRVDPAAVAASTEYLARSASMALKVKGIAAAAASVRSISAANEGIILSENIGDGGDGPVQPDSAPPTTYGEMTISVPSDRLDRSLDALARVGTVVRRQSSSDNVRDEYVDTQSRVQTMRASVDRVRALMTKATDIAQVVTLESELSRREADLEALEAQLASLKDRVARSPIQVSLTASATVVKPKPDQDTGFLAGLTSGWRAFTSSVAALLTVVGALLPFVVVALVIGLPVWWGVRRRRARRTQPAATAAG
jgi:hypothetical protein